MITSGFYDSVNGDRKYNAEQLSAIFDGIINDGVLAKFGEALSVQADTGNNVIIGKGRAWFNSTWVYNDAPLAIAVPTLPANGTHVVDILVIEVDRSTDVRNATAKFATQFISSDAALTESGVIELALDSNLINTTTVHQHPIAAIYRKVGTTDEITQADVTNLIGTSRCPFVTGIIDVVKVDDLVVQWESQFDQWFNSIKTNLESAGDLSKLASDVANLQNGTTPAGDANKLGGKDASEYASAADVTKITDGTTPAGDANKLGGKDASEYASAKHGHGPSKISTTNESDMYFGSRVMANTTAVAAIGDAQVRNIYAGTTDMTAGSSALASGAIYVVYE